MQNKKVDRGRAVHACIQGRHQTPRADCHAGHPSARLVSVLSYRLDQERKKIGLFWR